jgi:hypothetical protein
MVIYLWEDWLFYLAILLLYNLTFLLSSTKAIMLSGAAQILYFVSTDFMFLFKEDAANSLLEHREMTGQAFLTVMFHAEDV